MDVDYRTALQTVFRDVVPLIGFMDVQIVSASPGHVRLRLPADVQNRNHVGTLYAGALYSFLEVSGGALLLCSIDVSRWIPIIVEGSIRYRRPANGALDCALSLSPSESAALVSSLEADPRHRWTLRAEAVDERGTAVCEADLVYRLKSAG